MVGCRVGLVSVPVLNPAWFLVYAFALVRVADDLELCGKPLADFLKAPLLGSPVDVRHEGAWWPAVLQAIGADAGAVNLSEAEVSALFAEGIGPEDALVSTEYDRAAPRGVGGVKAAGNYAPDVLPSAQAKDKGFPIVLYLDAQHQKYVEEFSTSNFLGVTADGTLVAPSSPSILPSCTKGVVLQVARDMGIKGEERPLPYEELAHLREVAACGTAVPRTFKRTEGL